MPTRVAYWTSAFESRMEAIASEVSLLRHHFPSSVAWGLHSNHWLMLSKRRGFCLHPKFQLLFRTATKLFEPLFHLNHIVGSVGDWFYLVNRKTRPTVLTAATASPGTSEDLLGRVDRFVVEYPAGKQELEQLGVDADRIRTIMPPVDLNRFRPQPAPSDTFTVLFASSPERADWLETRGVLAILEAAQIRPQMNFRLIWRPWGESLAAVQQAIRVRELKNVELIHECISDMSQEFARVHVSIAPFGCRERCKPAPNSLIESLAAGRPILCTPIVGFAEIIDLEKSGRVCQQTGESIAEELDRIQVEYQTYSIAARNTAEKHFDQELFLSSYSQLYNELVPMAR